MFFEDQQGHIIESGERMYMTSPWKAIGLNFHSLGGRRFGNPRKLNGADRYDVRSGSQNVPGCQHDPLVNVGSRAGPDYAAIGKPCANRTALGEISCVRNPAMSVPRGGNSMGYSLTHRCL